MPGTSVPFIYEYKRVNLVTKSGERWTLPHSLKLIMNVSYVNWSFGSSDLVLSASTCFYSVKPLAWLCFFAWFSYGITCFLGKWIWPKMLGLESPACPLSEFVCFIIIFAGKDSSFECILFSENWRSFCDFHQGLYMLTYVKMIRKTDGNLYSGL